MASPASALPRGSPMVSPARPLASISLILDAVRAHILPTPLLKALPSLLQLFAHLELVAGRIQYEAHRALAIQIGILAQLDNGPEEMVVAMGGMRKEDIDVVDKMAQSGRSNVMFGLSLELRKHHVLASLRRKKLDARGVGRLIDAYFPQLDPEDIIAPMNQPLLFNQILKTADDIATVQKYRKDALGWLEDAQDAVSRGKSSVSLFPKDEKTLNLIAGKMLREAERVVNDYTVFTAIFSSNDQTPSRILPDSEPSNRRHTLPAGSMVTPVNQPVARQPRQSEPAPRPLVSPLPPSIPTVPRNIPSLGEAEPIQKKRPRSSLPSSGLPPSTGPEYTAAASPPSVPRNRTGLHNFDDKDIIRHAKRPRYSDYGPGGGARIERAG